MLINVKFLCYIMLVMFVTGDTDFAEKGVGKSEPVETRSNGQGARTQTTEDRNKVSYGNVECVRGRIVIIITKSKTDLMRTLRLEFANNLEFGHFNKAVTELYHPAVRSPLIWKQEQLGRQTGHYQPGKVLLSTLAEQLWAWARQGVQSHHMPCEHA